MITEPTLNPAALVIIRTRAFDIILVTALKAVNIEVAHIGAYLFKVLDKFAI